MRDVLSNFTGNMIEMSFRGGRRCRLFRHHVLAATTRRRFAVLGQTPRASYSRHFAVAGDDAASLRRSRSLRFDAPLLPLCHSSELRDFHDTASAALLKHEGRSTRCFMV